MFSWCAQSKALYTTITPVYITTNLALDATEQFLVLQHYTGLWVLRRYYIFRDHHYGQLWAKIRTYWWKLLESSNVSPSLSLKALETDKPRDLADRMRDFIDQFNCVYGLQIFLPTCSSLRPGAVVEGVAVLWFEPLSLRVMPSSGRLQSGFSCFTVIKIWDTESKCIAEHYFWLNMWCSRTASLESVNVVWSYLRSSP